MTSTSPADRSSYIDLDQLDGAGLILLPLTDQGGAGLYPEWGPGLARQLREAGVPFAWARRDRVYAHAFSAELDAAVQVAVLLAEPITQAAVATIIEYLRGLITTASNAPRDIKVDYAMEVDRSTGRVSDFSTLTIPVDAPVDVVALTKEFNAGRVDAIRAAKDRS